LKLKGFNIDSTHRSSLRHNIIKISKVKDRVLKAEERIKLYIKEFPLADFSAEIL
jgi:hypothetical protein